MWNLPRDLAEEVLCRVPLKSLKMVRSTCKTWNTLSKGNNNLKKNKSFMNLKVMMLDYTIYLISFDLDELCMKREAKLFRLDDQFQVDELFHCDGLLLCMNNDYNHTKLVVWNPYCFQTRFIDTPPKPRRLGRCAYAMGHNDNHDHHKILRFIIRPDCVEFLIYDLNNADDHTWRAIDDFATREWTISWFHRGISLKGNTYFFAQSRQRDTEPCLVCFDFTTERFGPRLPLPCASLWYPDDTLSLSSVRDEQLVLLYQSSETLELEIWVTSKIEPDAVSWNTKVFLAVEMTPPLTSVSFQFDVLSANFFIDEEKKVAVVFDQTRHHPRSNVAYVIGVDGSLKEVDFGQSEYIQCYPLVSSYVPSLVRLN